ncbi:MAG: DUF4340 domain-containing protein [bacterium]
MGIRSSLLLGVIAAALGVYIYLDVWHAPNTAELEKQARRVIPFKKEAIQRMELTQPKESFVFIKRDEAWVMEKPIAFPADEEVVRDMLLNLDMAQRLDTIAKWPDFDRELEQFGLKEPRGKLEFKTKDGSRTLAIGRETPVPGGVYALLSGGKKKREIIVIDQSIAEFFKKDLNDWRSHEVFDFHVPLITGIVMRREQQEVEVKREDDGSWKITKPLVTQADAERVKNFLEKVLDFHAVKFVSETDAASATYGLTTPNLILEVSDFKQTRTLKIGFIVPGDLQSVFAVYGSRPAVFTLPTSALEELGDVLNKVRDRRVVSYPYTAKVKELSIDYGNVHYHLERPDEGPVWRFVGLDRQADFSKVDSFLGQLFAARAVNYPASISDKDFSKPLATVTWRSPAPSPQEQGIWNDKQKKENEAREEKLVFGSIKNNEVLVQTPRQPSGITLPKEIMDHFPSELWSWFPSKIFELREEAVESVTWEGGGAALTVQSVGKGEWKAGDGQIKVNTQAFDKQLQLLGGLEAVRWVGPANPKDFTNPILTLTIKSAGKTDRLIFAKVFERNALVRLNDDHYAFLISKEDYQALSVKPIQIPNANAVVPAPQAASSPFQP